MLGVLKRKISHKPFSRFFHKGFPHDFSVGKIRKKNRLDVFFIKPLYGNCKNPGDKIMSSYMKNLNSFNFLEIKIVKLLPERKWSSTVIPSVEIL